MYAVVRIAGEQLRVSRGERLRVPRLQVDEGSKEQFTDVLLVSQDGDIRVGAPNVLGATIEVTILRHGRGPKVIVFKMKRRKKYRRRNGHRQDFTEIQVDDILLN